MIPRTPPRITPQPPPPSSRAAARPRAPTGRRRAPRPQPDVQAPNLGELLEHVVGLRHRKRRVLHSRLGRGELPVLAQALRTGQVVVTDNLSAHEGKRVRELIEDRGRELLYLPPYSPDPNPMEEAFSRAKRLLRVIGGRTKGALVEATGKALDVVRARDARGLFTHRGYGGLERRT